MILSHTNKLVISSTIYGQAVPLTLLEMREAEITVANNMLTLLSFHQRKLI